MESRPSLKMSANDAFMPLFGVIPTPVWRATSTKVRPSRVTYSSETP